MKTILLFCVFCLFFTGTNRYGYPPKKPVNAVEYWNAEVTTCGSSLSAADINSADNGKFIGRLPGWGRYSYRISTGSDSAQVYFDQGLNMYYSYHTKEALASFREAARFDPGCAMAYWGQALAMGPNYNSAHSYAIPENIAEVLELMNKTAAGSASAKESALFKVMNLRYPAADAVQEITKLNLAYAQGMRTLMLVYPQDGDIKALYIDAVMLIHPWDFWNNDGSAKEWTPEIVALCENLLQARPKHPGALHYYIHLTEASRQPERALSNAQLLKDLFPGVAHMVHMSSHVYQRNGLYSLGVDANDQADANLLAYDSLAKNLSLNKHSFHYFAVQAFCGLTGAMYTKGMRDALKCRKSVSAAHENTYAQYLYMMPVFTQVRLGKWNEILKDTVQPDPTWTYAGIIGNFAKGLAYVYTGRQDSAISQLVQLRGSIKDPILKKRRIPFNTSLQGALIAEHILNAVILFDQKRSAEAIKSLNEAIETEDQMIYSEPMDWPVPARQFLGAYLLKQNRPADAEQVYKMDLILNPGNGWSLLGLYQSLIARHKIKTLSGYKSAYLRSFSNAEQIPAASVYIGMAP
jgi:tetratricopeptide (TPR) repeat protein